MLDKAKLDKQIENFPWTPDMTKLHKNLAWRPNIHAEEVQGLEMCTISMHN